MTPDYTKRVEYPDCPVYIKHIDGNPLSPPDPENPTEGGTDNDSE